MEDFYDPGRFTPHRIGRRHTGTTAPVVVHNLRVRMNVSGADKYSAN